MPRHFNISNHAHELTFSCYKNSSFLSNGIYCDLLAEAIIRAGNIHRFDFRAYVFMPDHVPLLIWPRENDYSISKILLSLKQPVARKARIYASKNDLASLQLMKTGQTATAFRFWQDGGGYDRNLFSSEALINSVRYIHNNPVRKGLVSHPAQWKWSSFGDWEGISKGPITIDRCNFPPL